MDRDVEFWKTDFAKSVFSIYPGLQITSLDLDSSFTTGFLVKHQVTQCSIEVPVTQSVVRKRLTVLIFFSKGGCAGPLRVAIKVSFQQTCGKSCLEFPAISHFK